MIFDASGNLYGTSFGGGGGKAGTVFKLTLDGGGIWTETLLHDFQENARDGNFPNHGLVSDTQGNLYGTTAAGGPRSGGMVFELKPSGGAWTEKPLHFFNSKSTSDGYNPICKLNFDSGGNLYGTTFLGGTGTCSGGCGIIFELRPAAGLWAERVVHNFLDNGIDGNSSSAGVIFDSAGNLYSTARYGGPYGGLGAFNDGVVYEINTSSRSSYRLCTGQALAARPSRANWARSTVAPASCTAVAAASRCRRVDHLRSLPVGNSA